MADPVEMEMMAVMRGLPDNRRLEMQMLYQNQRKDRNTALVLQLLVFLGLPGIGRMYMGDVGLGVLQLLASWFTCGFGILWPIIDLFLIQQAVDAKNRELLQRVQFGLQG